MRISIKQLRKLIKESYKETFAAKAGRLGAAQNWFEKNEVGMIVPIGGPTPRMSAEQIFQAKEEGEPIFWSRKMALSVAKEHGDIADPEIGGAVSEATIEDNGVQYVDAAQLLGLLGH